MLASKSALIAFVTLTFSMAPLFAMRLQLEPGTKAVIKLGVCPYPNYLQRCGEEKDGCLDDLDCPHENLCCNDGCHRSCSSPRMENIVGYVVLGAELPLNTPTVAPTAAMAHSKSLSVSPDSWNLLLGYLCAVADRLYTTNQFHCSISCSQDSDCPQSGDHNSAVIKCCNRCCLDPTQFIIQQRTNMLKNDSRANNVSQQRTTRFDDSQYNNRPTTPPPPPSSKPGMCPPVLVQSSGGFMSGSCDRRCNGDRDCYGPEKCCSNGCGYACQRPISFSMGYGESLAAPLPHSGPAMSFFSNPVRSAADYVLQTTTMKSRMISPVLHTVAAEKITTTTRAAPMTVFLGVQPHMTTVESAPNSKRCILPPTSYTECIGVSPWRTRYYYHKGLNQCLPIYRCVRSGNNFQDLSSCENACVEKDNSLFY